MIGTIYKITDKDGKVYYGSTKSTIYHRLSQHKCPSYSTPSMTKIMDKESMVIEALEQYYFDEDTYNKKFIEKRERSYIDNNPCINKQRPGRTKKEYNKEYNEKNKESIKEYYEKNKESICEQKKEYREKNKESIKEKGKEKLGCRTCKYMIRRSDFVRHTKSKRHQSNLSLGGSTATKS